MRKTPTPPSKSTTAVGRRPNTTRSRTQTQDLLESSNSLAQTWSSSGQEVNVSRPSTSSGTEAIRPHLRRPSSFVEVEHVETMQKQVRTALADLDEIKSAKLPSRPQINTLFSLAFAPNADERNVRPKTADLMHSATQDRPLVNVPSYVLKSINVLANFTGDNCGHSCMRWFIDCSTCKSVLTLALGGQNFELEQMQQVMKKMYKSNLALAAENKQLRDHLEVAGLALPSETRREKWDGNEELKKESQEEYAKPHLLFLLRSRETQVQKLRQELERLQIHCAELERKQSSHLDTSLNVNQSNVNQFNVHTYSLLRKEYEAKLNERISQIKVSSKLPKDVVLLINQLQRNLVTEAVSRNVEKLFFNSSLHQLEKQAAEHAVERRLWERTRMELTSDIKKRDEIAERVETYTYTILERYHKLQRELKVLRENSRIETKK